MAIPSSGIFDSVLVYQFLKRLVTPFEKFPAYKTGVIDKDGKVIVPKNKRTQEQRNSFKIFDNMVLKLKRLLAKIPGGRSKIASYAAALWFVREHSEWDEDRLLNEDIDLTNDLAVAASFLGEDAPANATGSGVVGTGDNAAHWSGKRTHNVLFHKNSPFRRHQVVKSKKQYTRKKKHKQRY
tara:strand:- start:12055 stop:12600 length:546 start_codon:yes stop_codon:yes gene_type:complete